MGKGTVARKYLRTTDKNQPLAKSYTCSCAHCGQMFFSPRPHAKYCGRTHRQAAYESRKRAELLRKLAEYAKKAKTKKTKP